MLNPKCISPTESTLQQQETRQNNAAMRSEILKAESWNMQRLDRTVHDNDEQRRSLKWGFDYVDKASQTAKVLQL